MTESLLDFQSPNIHKIGQLSYDYHTFILFRKSSQIVRKYNAIGVSVSVLQELVKLGCQLIIIKLDGVARYKVTPEEWMRHGILDQLTPTQEPHSFMPISRLRRFE